MDKIMAAYEAARRANEAVLDALEAAETAGLKIDHAGDPLVQVERAALAAILSAPCTSLADAERRHRIVLDLVCAGDHTDLLEEAAHCMAG